MSGLTLGPLPGLVLSWRLDPLGAFFALVIVGVSLAVTIYALGYGRHWPGRPFLGPAYLVFVASMLGVVVAGDAYTFLLAWETMSLASFALVVTDHRQAAVRSAGWVYLVMTHAATALITGAFLLLWRATGSLSFAEWAAAAPRLDPVTASAVFLLGLVGFGTKAGMIPVHVWLPRAHPVAPSHVSALMSGVMIKLGIYGILRVAFEWTAPGPAWWGVLVLLLGAGSAVLGVLYALMQHDLKRLLAYHSVENIGIILLGAGAALLARSEGQSALAAIGLTAALFHVANHAVFKALLFMGAGAVDAATGTRDLEHLGGLVKRMPATAALFLVGSAAISGLPPLNGFASEWLTFQALLVTGRGAPTLGLALPPLVGGALLALTGALALACFVKAFGVGFLGLARSARAAEARETGRAELAGMAILAAACVALGLGAAPVVSALGPATAALAGSAMPAGGAVLHAQPAGVIAAGSLALPWLAVAVVALALAVPALARLAAGPVRTRVVETWACGVVPQPLNEYTSTAFAKPIRLMFRDLVRPVRDVDVIHRLGTRFVARIEYRSGVAPVFERYLYRALTDRLVATARLLRQIQNGSLQAYLAYLCAALVALLVLAR